MMKVLHVIPSVALRDGGPSVAVRGMMRGLAALGVDVTLATTDADRGQRLSVPLDQPVYEDGVVSYYFDHLLEGWKFSWGMTRWLDTNISRFDVVHVHAVFSYPTIPACHFAARDGVPLVLSPHGALDPWCLRQGHWKKRPYLWLIKRSCMDRVTTVHVTSTQEEAGVTAIGYGARTQVISLGVAQQTAVRSSSQRKDSCRVLFLARLEPIKGLPLLIEAIHAVRAAGCAIELKIAGEGNPGYVRTLQRKVDELCLQAHVHFTGYVSGTAKQDALEWADLFVLPSYHENLGIAALEALAAGIPVIVSDQVGVATEVAAAEAGLVVACSNTALATALQTLVRNPVLRRRMSQNAVELVRRRFSWEGACRQLLALYEALPTTASSATCRDQPTAVQPLTPI